MVGHRPGRCAGWCGDSKMKTIFGHRKWIGLWLSVACVMGYPFLGKLGGITEATVKDVIMAVVYLYAGFAGFNMASKWTPGGYRNAGTREHNYYDPTGGAGE